MAGTAHHHTLDERLPAQSQFRGYFTPIRGLVHKKILKERAVLIVAPPVIENTLVGALFLYFLVLLQEFINAAGRVQQLLLARKKRMAGTANFNLEGITGLGRTGLERVAACASYCYQMISGMKILFHGYTYFSFEPQIYELCGQKSSRVTL
jgi:hypothetical protein